MYEIGPFNYSLKRNTKAIERKIFCDKKIIIPRGKLVLIAGPSGGGKSTFLQMLKGIIPELRIGEFEGQILYNNNPLNGDFFQKNLKKILFLFQNPFSQLIYPKAAEEFFFSMENNHFTREQMDNKKRELEKYFKLDKLWNKRTKDLSHGECQRLVLASLLAVDPEVLLLDEPTAFLDPLSRKEFYRWLGKYKGQKTIVIVDHHLQEISPFADFFIQVNADGEVREVESFSFFKNKTIQSSSLSFFNRQEEVSFNQFSLSNISFHYPDQEKLIENFSLQAKSGDIVVIKGKNGEGKSTLFKILAGMIKPLKGDIQLILNNKEIERSKQYKEIGFVFQNPESHFFYDTIDEELRGLSKEKKKFIFEHFLKDITGEFSPFLLSEGEKRRLSLLMSVCHEKKILFYDEPTFGQDEYSIALIKDLILQLKEQGKIQFIISHDEDFISSLKSLVYQIKNHSLEKVV